MERRIITTDRCCVMRVQYPDSSRMVHVTISAYYQIVHLRDLRRLSETLPQDLMLLLEFDPEETSEDKCARLSAENEQLRTEVQRLKATLCGSLPSDTKGDST